MRGAVPSLPHTSSWCGTLLSTVTTLPLLSFTGIWSMTQGQDWKSLFQRIKRTPQFSWTGYPKVSGLSPNEICGNLWYYSLLSPSKGYSSKLTRLTHKITMQLLLMAESCTIFSSRSRLPVRKLLDTPSCLHSRSRTANSENFFIFR
jgi:hypothetical protein